MQIGISTGLYYKKNYIEILDIIKASGFTNIELFLNQSIIDVPLLELKEALDERNLNVISIHTPLEFIAFNLNQDEQYWINETIKWCSILNCNLIVTHMVLEKLENNEYLNNLHKQNLLEYLTKTDTIITTENIPSYTNNTFLGDMDNFINFVISNKQPITFDTTHCAASGYSLIETFNLVKDHIKNIHLSNYDYNSEHKVLDNGQLNIIEFLEYLKENNYSGSVILELDFENTSRNIIHDNEEAIQKLRDCYNIMVQYTK